MLIFVQLPCLQHAQLCCATGIFIIWSDVSMHSPEKTVSRDLSLLKAKENTTDDV